MSLKALCNLDCFNCKYDDCINDRLEISDFTASEDIDKDIIRQRRGKDGRKMSKLALRRREEYKTEDRSSKKAYAEAYYSLNRNRLKKYRLENRERKSAYDRAYFERNKEKICEKNKIYGQKNKQHLRERQKEWREKNRDKIREYQHQYYMRKKAEK